MNHQANGHMARQASPRGLAYAHHTDGHLHVGTRTSHLVKANRTGSMKSKICVWGLSGNRLDTSVNRIC